MFKSMLLSVSLLAVLLLSACTGGAAPTTTPLASEAPVMTSAVTETLPGAASPEALTPAALTPEATVPVDATQAPTAAPTLPPHPGLELERLRNATYGSGFTQSGSATLVNGVYQEPPVGEAISGTLVSLREPVSYGVLTDGKAVAAVILASSPGGSGTFYELSLVEALSDGTIVSLVTVFLGDRVQINAMRFESDSTLVIDMIGQGPDDPMCCPSQEQRVTLRYVDGVMTKEVQPVIDGTPMAPEALPGDPAPLPGTPPAAGNPQAVPTTLSGVIWQWSEFELEADGRRAVNQPYMYTLEFVDDGTLRVSADCNSGSGPYTQSGETLQIGPVATTLMACPAGSLSDAFLQYLQQVERYTINGGQLYLHLAEGRGVLKFIPSP